MSENIKISDEKRSLLNDLINVTKEITSKYSGEKKLVTEDKPEVEKLLITIESILLFGLKNSLLDNIQGFFTTSNGSAFWNFAYNHLTKDEQKRFSSYKNLWTDRGRIKALIRSGLNERCMERYFLTWLAAENIDEFYENFSIMKDEKAIVILPKLAADLGLILFAIPLDVAEFNVMTKSQPIPRTEPIIAVPVPATNRVTIKSSANRRNIDDIEETVKVDEILDRQAIVVPISPPKYESSFDYSVNVPNFCETISICTDINDAIREEDTTSLSSSSDEEVERQVQVQDDNNKDNNSKDEIIANQRERIIELENKVLDLNVEIDRLRNLLATSTQKNVSSLANFHIAIPRAVLNKTKTKNFYIYEINIRSNDDKERWTIFKRYRDFYNFHKLLKKQYLQIRVLDFPPKKKLGNLEFDFVEERRQRLQVYLRHVLQNLPELASCSTRNNLEAKCQFFKS